MNRFLKSMAEVLEVDAVEASTRFRELPGWCSLKAFGILVAMENDWGTPLKIPDFLRLDTIGDLQREALRSLFAEVLRVERAGIPDGLQMCDINEWDSVNHLRLVMAVERRFGVSYPLERIPELLSLRDFL